MWMRALLALCALMCLTPSVRAGEDDYIRFTLKAPSPSPFHIIRYEVSKRGPATTAVHRRLLPGLNEGLHVLGLLTPEESDALFAQASEAFALKDSLSAAAPPQALSWHCEVFIDGKRHTFTVFAPEHQSDRRYATLFQMVRRTVLSSAGELPFRNVFYTAKERGWLNIESTPSARVFIDGFDTKLMTPLYSYELKAGTHEVRLDTPDGALSRSFPFKLEAQGTTTLRIHLE